MPKSDTCSSMSSRAPFLEAIRGGHKHHATDFVVHGDIWMSWFRSVMDP
jgi:hypothetical protein